MYIGESVPITVKTFFDEVDEYGQKHTSYTTRMSKGRVWKYQPNNLVESPLFNDVVLIVLTQDRQFSDNENAIIYDKEYHVVYTIDSKREFQVFLSKV